MGERETVATGRSGDRREPTLWVAMQCPRETCWVPDTACILGFSLDVCPSYNGPDEPADGSRTNGSEPQP